VSRRRTGLVVAVGAAALAALGGGAAGEGLAAFRFERSAVLQGSGPQSLPVDVPLLVGSAPFRIESWPGPMGSRPRRVARGGLRDLRFYDAEGREVPYLLVEPPTREPEWRRAARLLPIPATKKQSGFEADLGVATSVDRIHLEGIPAPFLKRLSLDGSGDRARWTRLAPEATLFDLPDSGLRQLELAFAPGLYRYLRVTWDDASSAHVSSPRELLARVASSDALAAAVVSTPLAFDRRASEPGTSRFRVRLPGPSLPIVALRLSVGGGNLSRQARVGEARLAGVEAAPVRLGEARLKRAVRDVLAADELRIPIETPTTAQLELEVDDGDNPPLDLLFVEAELAELPFIYLESEKGGTLVARWGQPALDAPRYDLESARERAARAAASAGAWGEARPASAESEALGVAASLPGVGPSLETSPFRYVRTLPDGPAGLVTVPLDAAVLAHCKGGLSGSFADLRIVDSLDRQLPYLLDRRPEPLLIPLPAPARDAAAAARFPAATSVYRLKLPYAELPPARLVLRTSARVFEREVQALVEPLSDESRRRRGDAPRLVASASWRHADPDSAAAALTLQLPTLARAELLLAVAEGDNSTLPLASAELLLPSWHVRVFRPGPGELRVVYGHRTLAPPRYDLALLATSVLASPAHETSLAGEQEHARSETEVLRPRAFWALMLGAAFVLLGLIVHLVRGARVSEGS
jgi:Protein of unknown function (DUF3999)